VISGTAGKAWIVAIGRMAELQERSHWRGRRLSAESAYTRMVSWRRPIGIVLLALLTGLPASGVVCGLFCESATTSTSTPSGHHHISTNNIQRPDHSPAAAEVRVGAVSEHDCSSHDGILSQTATGAVESASSGVHSIPLVTSHAAQPIMAVAEAGLFACKRPLATSPPTTPPLVLRV